MAELKQELVTVKAGFLVRCLSLPRLPVRDFSILHRRWFQALCSESLHLEIPKRQRDRREILHSSPRLQDGAGCRAALAAALDQREQDRPELANAHTNKE